MGVGARDKFMEKLMLLILLLFPSRKNYCRNIKIVCWRIGKHVLLNVPNREIVERAIDKKICEQKGKVVFWRKPHLCIVNKGDSNFRGKLSWALNIFERVMFIVWKIQISYNTIFSLINSFIVY